MQDHDDEQDGYRWESGYEKTWEVIDEDASGFLEPSITEMIMKNKRRRLLEREAAVRLGIMRHVYIVLDTSQAMGEQDIKPTRHLCTLKILQEFVPEFHDHNPISQLGIITTQNKLAKKFSDLSNNPQKHLENMKKLEEIACRGEPSVQNSLEVAMSSLKHLPSHTSREVIFIFGALTSCDPGEIETTIKKVKEANIRVSFVGLAAEVRICKQISIETGGNFAVCLNDMHLKELIMEHLEPPPATTKMDHTLIKVGFPHQADSKAKPALCMCHVDELPPLNTHGYYCPQCAAKYCSLPAECKVCGLMLVTAPHLARSYRHLFPLNHFDEVPLQEVGALNCYGCQKLFTETTKDKILYRCSRCKQIFCFECDIFLHEAVHACPGCASSAEISKLYGTT